MQPSFSSGPGGAAPRPGAAPTAQQLAHAQLLQQQQAMQAAFAANPALLAAHQQQFMRLQAAQQAANGPAAAAAAAAAAARASAAAKPGMGAGGKPLAAPGSAQAAAAAAVRAAEAVPAKKGGLGRKRRAADLRLPDRGDLLMPDSPLFAQLQDAERRVDMLISRKKHELQEMFASFRRGPPGSAMAGGSARRRLRVYIRCEHFHQGAAPDAAEPPSWALTISGRLLGKDKAEKGAGMGGLEGDEGGHHHKHHFTHYVKRLEVQLDPAQYPGEAGRFLWDKARHGREHREAVQIRRLCGTAPTEATITLELDHQPAQWRLSPALAAALGLRGLHSLPYVLQALWGYVKAKQLYEPNDRGPVSIRCDDRLRDLFGGAASVELTNMAEALKPHLTPPEPVKLTYTIRPDGAAVAHPDCYDFEVEVPLSTDLPPYMAKAGTTREVESLDVALTGLLTRLGEHRRRRTYLLAFAQNPVDFIQAMVAAQGRDLRMAASKEGEAHELLATGDVFKEKWVDDCVINYMARKQQQVQAQQQVAALEQQQVLAQQQALQQAAVHVAAAQQQQQAQAQAVAAVAAAAAQQQAAAAAAAAAVAPQKQQQALLQQQQQQAAAAAAAAAAMQGPGGGSAM